jgi:hypothetical protein
MNAMELMMKQLGLDPEQLRQSAENIGKLTAALAADMAEVKAQNTRIEQKLDTLLAERDTPAEKAVPQITQQIRV